MNYKCITVDDEPIAREILEDYIGQTGCLENIKSFSDPVEALTYLTQNKIDLIFLDINMPKIDGISFIRSMDKHPDVILTTAHREYAIDGFDLRVVDYLLKPFSFERFMKAVNHFLSTKKDRPADLVNNTVSGEDILYIRENRKTHRIPVKSILYIESCGEYLKFHYEDRKIMTLGSLVSFENSLPPGSYARIHNSYIINISHVKSYTSFSVDMGKIELPVSRKYKESFLKKIEKPVR